LIPPFDGGVDRAKLAGSDGATPERPTAWAVGCRQPAIGSRNQRDEMTPGGFIPRVRVGAGGVGPDPTGVTTRSNTLEPRDAVKDRPVQLREIFGKGRDGLDGLG
jgi:hypothetical protein